MTTEFEKAYQRLFYLRGADTKHMNDCELVWRSRDAEIASLQAQVDALAVALQNTLHELWSDRHSHQDDEGFRSDFAEEYAALAAVGR